MKYKEEKNKLFISVIFILFYLIYLFVNSSKSSKEIENFLNIIQYIVAIPTSIYFLYLYKKDIDLKKCYKSIFIVSLIFFLINIISGIFGFIVYNKVKPKLKKLPKLKDITEFNKIVYIVAFIFCVLVLFFMSEFVHNLFGLVLVYSSLFVIMSFLFKKRLLRDFKEFRKYFREYNSLVLKTWGKSLLVTMILNILIQLVTNLSNATNQINLQEMFEIYPLLIVFLSTIYAPVAEELMFRGTIKEFIKNKWAFILISGLIFGFIHVIDDFKTVSELLFGLVYSSLGFFLAYLYQKTNNICTNIYFHFLQNSMAVIGMIILYFTT